MEKHIPDIDQDAERRAQGLFSEGPMVVFRWIPKEGWPVEYCSSNVAVQLGYAQSDFCSDGLLFGSLLHPDDVERISEEVSLYTREHIDTFEQEYRLKLADGSYCWFYDFTRIVRSDNGEVRYYDGYLLNIEQRKKSDKLLEDRTAQLQAIFDNSNVGIMLVSSERTLLRVNSRLVEIFGYSSPDEMLGMNTLLMHRDKKAYESFSKQYFSTLRAHRQTHIEYLARKKDGTDVWLQMSGQAVDSSYPADLTKGLIWVAEDITERKKNELALLEREATFNGMMDTTNDGFWICDMQGRFLEVNNTYVDIIGYSREQLLTKSVVDIEALESETDIAEKIETIRQRGNVMFETQHLCADQSVVDMEVSISYWPGFGGRLFVFGRDITKRKQIEESLGLAARAIQSTSEGIMITDKNGVIQSVNPSFEHITGYSSEEAVGQNVSMLQSGYQDKAFYKNMWGAIEKDGNWHGEIWNRRKNGEVYPERLNINAVLNDEGEVLHYVGAFGDISDLKSSQEKIAHLAYHDALTGLPNRTLLLDRIRKGIARAKRDKTKLVLLFIDLDRFKAINDTLGHNIGDAVLHDVAESLHALLPAGDTLARVGGDEFVVMLEGQDDEKYASVLANNISKAFSSPCQVEEHQVYLSASIGISIFPQDATDEETLLKHADIAMYKAKSSGRDDFQFFEAEMTEDVFEHMVLENALHVAIERSEFILHYQPQIDMASNKWVGMEALIRWQHPELGIVSPARFIPLAEEAGMIKAIGSFVLKTALEQVTKWRSIGIDVPKISINLSVQQIETDDFVAEVSGLLERYSIQPKQVELEVTESMIMSNQSRVIDHLSQLRNLGIEIAVDDFGTGYSSLNYLKSLPLDRLKIDQSFVRDIANNQNDQAIVKAIIALSNALSLKIIAEGVETAEQSKILVDNGCSLAQGYFFSRPVDAKAIAKLFA